MPSAWTPRQQPDLIERFSNRSGAESAAFFGAFGLGQAYESPGKGSSKLAKISAAVEASRRRGDLDEVLGAAAEQLGLTPQRAESVQVEGESETMAGDKVFISHASADEQLAGLLKQMLILGGVPSERIFYSSSRTTGIPAGQDVGPYLRQSLQQAGLVIELLTIAFLSRPMCLIELGGAWVSETPTFPIVVTPLTRSEAVSAIGNVHLLELRTDEGNGDLYSELFDRLRSDIDLDVSARQWSEATSDFEARFRPLIGVASGSSKPTTPQPTARAASTIARDDDEFSFTGIVVVNGDLHGQATNNDGKTRSAILTATFFDSAGRIVGTDREAINEVKPGRSRTFTFSDVPSHDRVDIEVSTLI